MNDLEYEWIKKKVFTVTGIDLNCYREDQMKRLLGKALEKSGARTYVQWIKSIEGNPKKTQEFRDSITINVSSLFRDIDRWENLKSFYPDLVKKMESDSVSSLRFWSAGCSIGAEAYTMAILAEEMMAENPDLNLSYTVTGTDIDNTMISRARAGIYTDSEMKEVPEPILKKYFDEIERPSKNEEAFSSAEKFYKVNDTIKSKMSFMHRNLLHEAWDCGFNLIACRNVLIYFNSEAKKKLFKKFNESLKHNGILFIGGTEVLFNPGEYGFSGVGTGLYKKHQEGLCQ